ncbi:hypothetical protein FRB98_008636, partial [Tulasnella sp. 332]
MRCLTPSSEGDLARLDAALRQNTRLVESSTFVEHALFTILTLAALNSIQSKLITPLPSQSSFKFQPLATLHSAPLLMLAFFWRLFPYSARPFRFRILIIGKANTGKTTILQKFCSGTDIPIVRDRNGKTIRRLENLDPTAERGLHDINHEITYPTYPGFVFHDSQGLEAGSVEEAQKIMDFVESRTKMEDEQALHAVWYCVSGDDARPFGAAEMKFFDLDKGKGKPHNLPVVVAFTKYDALEIKAEGELGRENFTEEPTEQEIAARAEELFQEHFLKRVMTSPHPPAAH